MIFSVTFLEVNRPISEYAALAALAEEVGFDAVRVVDHLMYKPVWPILAAIAAKTNSIALGPGITNPYLIHPAVTAANLAALDELSGGRAILGIGKGTYFELLSVEPLLPIAAVREAILIIRRFLAGETSSFQGKLFKVKEGARFHYKPIRDRVPIFTGGKGPQAIQLAGELADEIKCGGVWTPEYLPFVRKNLAIGARRSGRDPSEVTITLAPYTCIAEDKREGERLARRALSLYLLHLPPATDILGIDPEEVRQVREASARKDTEAASKLISDRSLSCFTAWGTEKEIIPRLEELAAHGIESIDFPIPPFADVAASIRLLGSRVVSYFKKK